MKRITLPIETKVREFYGKLWLSLNLVLRGNEVVLGHAPEIDRLIDIIKPDVYVSKDPANEDFFERLQSAGVRVCALDTEGAVFRTLDRYREPRFAHSSQYTDAFFAWGPEPAKVLRETTGRDDNIYVTGNPRFDLLNRELRDIYLPELEDIKYHDYVLVNTNFSTGNAFKWRDDLSIRARTYERRLVSLFVEAILYAYSEDPTRTYIIRPHPSEDHSTYERVFEGNDSIHVEHSGDVRPWIMGADLLVHVNCTTGIESALLNKPVVAYRPIIDQDLDIELPNAVSIEASNREELYQQIKHFSASEDEYYLDKRQRETLDKYFHNRDRSATDAICDVIDGLESGEKDFDSFEPTISDALERRVLASSGAPIAKRVHDSLRWITGDQTRQRQRKYTEQKFPGLSERDVLYGIRRFGQHIETAGIKVDRVPLANDTFLIRKGTE